MIVQNKLIAAFFRKLIEGNIILKIWYTFESHCKWKQGDYHPWLNVVHHINRICEAHF